MGNQGIAPESIDGLSFDCFGTLIDWESGLLASLRVLLGVRATRTGRD
ncbi:hypothetical protein BH24CHL5_BH24CHL5_00400 [soil metagenome]